MRYYVYSAFGNQIELDSMLNFYEIGDDLYFTRSIEINAEGQVLKYSTEHQADEHGQLPEGEWDEAEAAKPETRPRSTAC